MSRNSDATAEQDATTPDATATQQAQQLVTPAEYARIVGVARSTVGRQIRDGRIPVSVGGRGGLIAIPADSPRARNLNADRCARAERKKQQAPASADSKVLHLVRAGQREVLDAIRRKAAELPQLLLELK